MHERLHDGIQAALKTPSKLGVDPIRIHMTVTKRQREVFGASTQKTGHLIDGQRKTMHTYLTKSKKARVP